MIVLILIVCTLAAPERCHEARLQFVSNETPAECSMQAPPTIAAWAEDHPGLRVARWRCVYPGFEDSGIPGGAAPGRATPS